MKAKTVCQPPFQVTIFRYGPAVIIETLDSEIAARMICPHGVVQA
jgi:hypothetical protein